MLEGINKVLDLYKNTGNSITAKKIEAHLKLTKSKNIFNSKSNLNATSELEENKLYEEVVKDRNSDNIKNEFEKTRQRELGSNENQNEPILIVAISAAAGHYITQSLCKRLNRNYGACSTRIFPGGCFQFENLLPFIKNQDITHCHTDPSENNIRILEAVNLKKVVVHLRDPRSAVLSLTHHIGMNCTPSEVWLYHPLMAPEPSFYTSNFEKQMDWMINVYMPICIVNASYFTS